jgi:hypothetical protein
MVKSDLFALLGEAVLKLLELEADDQPSKPRRTDTDPRASGNESAAERSANKRSTEEGAPAVDSGGNGP